MSLSPIASLTLLTGVTGTVTTFAPPAAYDPDRPTAAASDYVRNPEVSSPLTPRGLLWHAKRMGIEPKYAAVFVVPAETHPDNIKPGISRCTVGVDSYVVKECNPRYYAGAYDGYTLELEK